MQLHSGRVGGGIRRIVAEVLQGLWKLRMDCTVVEALAQLPVSMYFSQAVIQDIISQG